MIHLEVQRACGILQASGFNLLGILGDTDLLGSLGKLLTLPKCTYMHKKTYH